MRRVRSGLVVLALVAAVLPGSAASADQSPSASPSTSASSGTPTASPPAPAPSRPGAPSEVTARALPGSALVSWHAPGTGSARVTGYEVTATPGGAVTRTTGATNVVVKGLANGTEYRFTVRATSAAGTGDPSPRSPAVTPSATGVTYAHDADGRVTAVFDGSGAGSKISYDAVGNITGITSLPATALAVAQVWPPRAKAGTAVDVFGTAFGTDTSAVSVDFHGASAHPSSLAANHLRVTVPAAATSGTVTVTVGSASAGWSGFAVVTPAAPTVSGVDKRVVDGGGTVTVTGTHFDPDPALDVVSVNGTKATVTAATATTLTVTAPPFVVGGPVTVRTPDGTATGPDLVVPPDPYLAADVGWAGRLATAATTTLSVTAAQQVAVALFEVAPGQQGSVEVAGETFDHSYELHVYDPTGHVVAHSESASGDMFFNLSYLSTPGTYLVEIDPDGDDTGSVRVTPRVFTDPTAAVTVDGAAASLTTTVAGQKAVFTIAGQADERIMVTLSQDDASDVGAVSLMTPSGSVLASTGGTSSAMGPVSLPVTGTYTLVVAQYSSYVGTVTATVASVPPDLRQAVTVDGPAANLTVVAGQNAYLTFAGTAGQLITAEATPDWGWGSCDDTLTLTGPTGDEVTSDDCDDSVDRIVLPATGTYTLLFDPNGVRSGAFSVRVFTVPADARVSMAVNGRPATVTLGTDDQHGVFSFPATAGQKVFVACSLSGSLVDYSTVFRFASASGETRTAECDTEIELFDTFALDATGTDTITVEPTHRQTGTATLTVYPVPDDAQVTATTNGQPSSLTIGTPGQHGLFSFAATAGNPLRVTCALSSGLDPYSTKFVFTSVSGETQTGYCYSQPLFDTFTLDATGTDTIAVIPRYGETGTATVTITSIPPDAQVSTALDGRPATATIGTPGQHATFTFAATQGQRMYAACSMSGLDPGSTWKFTSASGTTKTSNCFSGGEPLFDTFALDATGTDTISLVPSSGGTGSATLTLYAVPADTQVSTALNGQPATVTLGTPGQHAAFSFAATQGQRMYAACSLSGMDSDSRWKFTSASGTAKTSNCYGGEPLFDTFALDATGTDTISLVPYNGSTGSATLTLYAVPADAAATANVGGPAVTLSTGTAGQNGVISFAGTAGQHLTLKVTANTYPSSPCCLELTVRNPAGSQVGSLSGPPPGSTTTFTSATSGTYTILVDPELATTGSVTVTLTQSTSAAVAAPVRAAVEDGSRPRHGGSTGTVPPKLPAAPMAAPKWTYHGTGGHGAASLSGVVRDTDAKPLANVFLRVDGLTAVTDSHGRFTLDGLPRGTRVLVIDGRAAGNGHRDHGVYSYQVHLKSGRNRLDYTPYLPLIDTAAQVRIDEPTRAPVVLRTPKVPGLEVHIPAGARITDADGKPVYKLGITPIPIDRTPIPMPPAVQIPIFFTVQPAGGQVTGGDVQVVYPNYLHDKPGTPASFWHYEKAGEGWESYGRGTVDAAGKQVVPAAGTVLHDFDGAMFNSTDGRQPADKGGFWDKFLHGDPVDTSTGLLQLHQTDLALPDVIPLNLDRAYNSGDTNPSGNKRPEGVGTDDTYDMFLSSSLQWQVADLNLADGSQVHYVRVSPGTSYTDAVMECQVSSGPFYKSRMYWNGLGWDVNLTDGSTLVFGEMAPLQEIRDAHGNTLVVIRAEKNGFGSYVGPVTSVRSPHGFWLAYSHDGSGRTTHVRDNAGRQVSYGYDTDGYLHTVTDVGNHTTTYNYDPTSGLLATIVDATGQTYLRNDYDGDGRVHQQTLADGGHFTFDYTLDGNGRVTATRTTDPAGHVTRDAFDANGRVTASTEAVGTPQQRTATLIRDPATGLVTQTTDALGLRTSFTYDEFGKVTHTTFKDGTSAAYSTSTTYNGPFNLPDTSTDPLGHQSVLRYDAAGDMVKATDPVGHSAVSDYNLDGTLKTSTDPLNHKTTYGYTDGLVTSTTNPDGATSTVYPDAAGRPVITTSPSGLSSRVQYDAANHVVSSTDLAGNTTHYSYDDNGNLVKVTDPLQHETRYTPDALDRVHVRTDPLGHTDTYTYDPDGQIASHVDRRGTKTVYTHDALEQLATAAYGVTATGTAESTVTYGHDPGSRLTSVQDSKSGAITTSFDDLANTVTATDPTGTITDSYDSAGRLVSSSASGLPATTYRYDDAGRLTTIIRGSQQVTYTYDDAGRQTSRQLPGGVTITPSYSDAGVLRTLGYANAGGTLGDLRYAENGDGERIGVTGSWARTNLPAAESGQTYDADDRLTGVSGHTLSYDDTGNLLSDGTNGYTWNARGQLTAVTQPAGTTTLSYDAGNKLAGVTSAGATTSYRYAGAAILTRTQGDGTTTSFLNGPGLDAPLTTTGAGGTRDFLPDALGSTLAVTDPAGNLATNYTYDPFGAASSDTPADSNPLRYTGRPSSPDLPAGLQDNRARDYSPALHRFLSADPVGQASGQTDPYTYAAGDPADNTDPSGNWVQYAAGCILGAGYETALGILTGRKHSWGDFLGGAAHGCLAGALLASPFGAEEELGGLAADAALETAPADEAALADTCLANSFTPDTRVEMADGSTKPIGKVAVGDRVMATDPATGRTGPATVTALIHHSGPHTMVRIGVAGGSGIAYLDATDQHPFYDVTTGRWTAAADLRPGDRLREPDGSTVAVTGVSRYSADLTADNLTVETDHTYYVVAGTAPVLVHNCGGYLPEGIEELAEENITDTGDTVLGHFPEYVDKALDTDASYFDIGDAWNGLTEGEQWAADTHFLDEIAARGDRVLLSVPKGGIESDSWLVDEVNYLTEEWDYTWLNQWTLVPKRW